MSFLSLLDTSCYPIVNPGYEVVCAHARTRTGAGDRALEDFFPGILLSLVLSPYFSSPFLVLGDNWPLEGVRALKRSTTLEKVASTHFT